MTKFCLVTHSSYITYTIAWHIWVQETSVNVLTSHKCG